jgi:hypothetical protein
MAVDVVYDPIGDRYAEPALRSLAWYGRYLVVGFAAGQIPKLPLNLVLLKGCDVRGVFWGSWIAREPEAPSRKHRRSRSLVRRGQAQRPCPCRLSAGGRSAGIEGHRRTQGDGQGCLEAVRLRRCYVSDTLFIRSSASRRRRGARA